MLIYNNRGYSCISPESARCPIDRYISFIYRMEKDNDISEFGGLPGDVIYTRSRIKWEQSVMATSFTKPDDGHGEPRQHADPAADVDLAGQAAIPVTAVTGEGYYQRVVEDQLDPICRYAADLTLIYVNQPYAALFAKTTDELIGQSLLDGVAPAYRQPVIDHIAALSPAKPVLTFENPTLLADGSLRWFHWTDRLLVAADGVTLSYQGVGRDITDRKLAEDAEREQRLFAEAMRDSLVALTSSLDVAHVMGQILASAAMVVPSDGGSIVLTENVAGAAQGRVAYLRGFTPAAAATLQGYTFPLAASPLNDVLASRQAYFIADTQHAGSWIVLEASKWIRSSIGVPIEARGAVVGILIADSAQPNHFVQRDVEKLQAFARYAALALENAYHATWLEARVAERTYELQSMQAVLAEERNLLRTLIDSVPDYIYAKDRQHRFIMSNLAHARDRGFQTSEGLLGKTDYDLFPSEMAEQFWNEEEKIFHDATPLLDHEQPSVGYSGGFTWALSNKVPVYNLTGEIAGLVGVTRDITERKARERQLRYHASLQQTVSDAVIVTDLQMAIQSWNPAAEAIYGWRAEEVIGVRVSELLYTRFPSNTTSSGNLRELYQKGWWRGEVVQRHKNGADLSFLSSVTLLKDDRGIPFGVVAVNHDITELKAAQDTLRTREAHYRLLAEHASDLVICINPAGNYTYVSPSSQHVLGYTPEELTGASAFQLIHPDDLALAQATHQTAVAQAPLTHPIIMRFRHKQGHYLWLEVSGRSILDAQSGELIEFITSSRNITERKRAEDALRQSEEKHRFLIETMGGGFAIYDLAERITYVNDRFCELLGYGREELIGTTSYDYVDAINADKINFHRALRRNAESSSYDLSVIRKDGQVLHLLIAASPLLDDQGQVAGSFAVVLDITIQKQAESALRAALDKEVELNELKSRFVSMASHEFRTPLATILAITESLATYRAQMSEEQIDLRLQKMKMQISHLKDIMEDVLQLARLQARRAEFNPVWLNLDGLCRSVIDEFQGRPDVVQRLAYHCDEPAREVKLDKKLMRQMIVNLVSNAIKYSAADQVVTIGVAYQQDKVVLHVQDQGIGIPAVDIPHLFEPFHRATNVGATAGTGLGLTIVKESVELHGGEITVESVVDVGTRFTLAIPTPTQMPA